MDRNQVQTFCDVVAQLITGAIQLPGCFLDAGPD
jgi:hypothetical protein